MKTTKGVRKTKTLMLTQNAVLASIVVLMAFTPIGYLRIGAVEMTFIMIPVAVGAFCPPVNCWAENFLMGIKGEFEDWKYGVLSNCCGVKITKDTLLNEAQQKALKKMSPQIYVSKECVPTAVFQGVLDELVPFEYAEIFIDSLTKAGVKNDFLVYENSGHALDKDPDKTDESRKIVLSYAEMYF